MVYGCGGGGGASAPQPAPTPALANLPVTLSTSSANVTVDEGQSQTFGFTASYSGTSTSPIVADVRVDGQRYTLNGTPTASGTSFNVSLKTASMLPGGTSTGNVTFRLCTSADCSTVYPGSTQTFTVNLDVRLRDWATFQRDAAHTGYVAVNYNTADFTSAWSFATGQNQPSEIAARRGSIFVNVRQEDGVLSRAINAENGTVIWSYNLGRNVYFGGPAYGNGRVASLSMSSYSDSIPIQLITADSGRSLGVVTYASQGGQGGVPTFVGDDLYYQAGEFGNVVYAANTAFKTQIWQRDTFQPGAEGFV